VADVEVYCFAGKIFATVVLTDENGDVAVVHEKL
jgi:hypothetical protein